MIIPVRCFSCGKVGRLSTACATEGPRLTVLQVTGDLWERYLALIDQNVPDGYADPLKKTPLSGATKLTNSA